MTMWWNMSLLVYPKPMVCLQSGRVVETVKKPPSFRLFMTSPGHVPNPGAWFHRPILALQHLWSHHWITWLTHRRLNLSGGCNRILDSDTGGIWSWSPKGQIPTSWVWDLSEVKFQYLCSLGIYQTLNFNILGLGLITQRLNSNVLCYLGFIRS